MFRKPDTEFSTRQEEEEEEEKSNCCFTYILPLSQASFVLFYRERTRDLKSLFGKEM